uniref:Nuclear transcription factor Y subunit gamma n=1 Tax=Culex pipiens TaxID=7175 RepID=A0A8D8ABJ2_CULPI
MTDPASATSPASEKLTEAQRNVEEFWPEVAAEIHRVKHIEPGNQLLPLARIKKIMKLDEDVKMISAEAPLLFAKAAEIFIQELTLRAWLHTEDNKRRTLQRSDIAMAIAKYDMFDFLIDIVPREEIKPARRDFGARTTADDTKYYFQLAQQHQMALQQDSGSSSSSGSGTVGGTSGNVVQLQTATTTSATPVQQQPQQPQFQTVQQMTGPQIATIATPGPNIILTNPAAAATMQNQVQLATQNQPIQLMQQVLTPSGEVTHIPIPLNQTQLNFIRTQMQLNQPGQAAAAPQPIIIHAPQTLQTGPTIIQAAPGGGLFLNSGHLIQHQPQQQQQQQMPQMAKPQGRPILKGGNNAPQPPNQQQPPQQQQQQPPHPSPLAQMSFASNLEFQQQMQQFQQQQQSRSGNPILGSHQPTPQQQHQPPNNPNNPQQQQQPPPPQQNQQQQQMNPQLQQLLAQRQQQQQQRAIRNQHMQQLPPNFRQQQQHHGGQPQPGGIINYGRDGGLSPTSNQLARWFSPELLAQASAGKLPSLNIGQAMSLEEFERNMQHSSATVHN